MNASYKTDTLKDADVAADILRDGELVAFATETVYGLGADATNGKAIAKVFEAKQRPAFDPLIVHVADLSAAKQVACLLYTSPSPRDQRGSRMPSSA